MFVLTEGAGARCLPCRAQLCVGRLQAEPVGTPACRAAFWGSWPQRFDSGSGAGHGLSGVVSPQRHEELDHHGHSQLKLWMRAVG